jgi:hypothetical protein
VIFILMHIFNIEMNYWLRIQWSLHFGSQENRPHKWNIQITESDSYT